ncbi:MAG TPA: phosphopantetheine-binding protein, partial [Pyrinomonadaceae bacterium]|nr:phosphopantetheine-binding protein [Pyrinomonadaceae bacterium]
RTDVESDISGIWQEVLRLERVGIYDNFFDLGGHSLLMIQVHNKLRETFKFDVSMVELFEYPTVNSLAEHLTRRESGLPAPEQQDEHDELAARLREGRDRLRQRRRTRV